MFEKLQADYQRFLEVEAALLDPAVSAPTRRGSRRWPRSGASSPSSPSPTAAISTSAAQIAEAEALAEAEADHELKRYYLDEVEALRAQEAEVGEPSATSSTTAPPAPTTRA